MSTVIRNGETYEIPSEELVVGDVMNIRKDYKIVADCVIIDSTGLACEEGDLTGEPDARYKKSVDVNTWNEDVAELSPCPFLLKGAKTVKGTGRALVVCVGRSTNQGQAGQAMDFEDEDTPLQEKLGAVVEIIGWIGIGAAGLTFIAMTIRLICTIFVQKERDIKD